MSRHRLNKKISIVSIVAGKKIIEFKKRIKNIKNFFRVMPNMPAQIGQSMKNYMNMIQIKLFLCLVVMI